MPTAKRRGPSKRPALTFQAETGRVTIGQTSSIAGWRSDASDCCHTVGVR